MARPLHRRPLDQNQGDQGLLDQREQPWQLRLLALLWQVHLIWCPRASLLGQLALVCTLPQGPGPGQRGRRQVAPHRLLAQQGGQDAAALRRRDGAGQDHHHRQRGHLLPAVGRGDVGRLPGQPRHQRRHRQLPSVHAHAVAVGDLWSRQQLWVRDQERARHRVRRRQVRQGRVRRAPPRVHQVGQVPGGEQRGGQPARHLQAHL
mmetsp:Transcript_54882/g.119524  ORF Transcript_54882/g.119524 Transcript_54882/m.119524 type:complete len:205 (+) Transcript_54882:459-1073(+)